MIKKIKIFEDGVTVDSITIKDKKSLKNGLDRWKLKGLI